MATRLSYDAVCAELDRRQQITLGFERIRALLGALGNPERGFRTVQVVGTNGKGTTAVALAKAFESSGRPSGTYLSPHVTDYTERVMIRDRRASAEEFAAGMGTVITAADEEGIPASQFELLTAGALFIFREVGVRWAVLEAGLGARHDATSAAGAEAVVLTNVGLDHTEYLGGSIEEIAREKLASVRPGGTLILGTPDSTVVGEAREASARVGARLVELPVDPEAAELLEGSSSYVARNALLGVRAAEELLGETIEPGERREILRSVRLPARFEVCEVSGVPVVVDGGHNLSGIGTAIEGMQKVYGGRPLAVVFGCLRDKDVAGMLSTVKKAADALYLTRPEGPRAVDPGWLEEKLRPEDHRRRRARVIEDPGRSPPPGGGGDGACGRGRARGRVVFPGCARTEVAP